MIKEFTLDIKEFTLDIREFRAARGASKVTTMDLASWLGSLGRLGWLFIRFSVRTFDQLEYGNVGAFQPRLQRVPADRAVCVTSVRHQELFFSTSVLRAAIGTSDKCRHSGNMCPGPGFSSMQLGHNQAGPLPSFGPGPTARPSPIGSREISSSPRCKQYKRASLASGARG